MGTRDRVGNYVSLWLYAIAFGFIEACVVVYLRELYLHEPVPGAGAALQVTEVALPAWTVRLELVREACTIVLLASVGWLASARAAGRWGAFLVGFGVWDLMYYLTLRVVIGWPQSLGAWDILFLIPVPWVAPVWAPSLVAVLFVTVGSWLFLTADRPRHWRWSDAAPLLAGCVVIVGSFLVESGAAMAHRVPKTWPWWLYWFGLLVAVGAVVRAERRR